MPSVLSRKMKILQNTSNHLLNIAIQKHQSQVVALQEVWFPSNNFSIPGFKLASKWYKEKNENENNKTIGRYVVVFCQRNAKIGN